MRFQDQSENTIVSYDLEILIKCSCRTFVNNYYRTEQYAKMYEKKCIRIQCKCNWMNFYLSKTLTGKKQKKVKPRMT